MHFDGTINLGNILTMVALVGAAITAWFGLKSALQAQGARFDLATQATNARLDLLTQKVTQYEEDVRSLQVMGKETVSRLAEVEKTQLTHGNKLEKLEGLIADPMARLTRVENDLRVYQLDQARMQGKVEDVIADVKSLREWRHQAANEANTAHLKEELARQRGLRSEGA